MDEAQSLSITIGAGGSKGIGRDVSSNGRNGSPGTAGFVYLSW